MLLVIAACLVLEALPLIAAARQMTHDHKFRPDFVIRVTEQDTSVACVTRFTTLINGTSPGPTIHLREDQTTWLRVYNDLGSRNLTMHWHGLSQSVAPFSDGTPQASQWPIKAGHYFDYEVRPKIGEAGTYFYHSHVGFQAVSAAGPLIVEERQQHAPPYPYDDERMLFLSELFNKTDTMIEDELIRPLSVVAWTGEAETILVNGKSYPGLDANQSQTPEPWTKSDPSVQSSCGPEIVRVKPGKTYRIRVIGGAALNLVSVAFEDHPKLSVMAVDASYTRLVDTDRIQIASGQRFDFLLHTKTESELRRLGKSIFWIQLETRYRPINVTSYALLSYSTSLAVDHTIPSLPPAKAPLTITNQIQDWLEYTLQPLNPNGFPNAKEVTRQVVLSSAQLLASSGVFASVQNRTWTESDEHLRNTSFDRNFSVGTPYLIDIYKRGDEAIPDYEATVKKYGGWDPELNVYVAKVGEIIDIILVNEPNGLPIGFDIHPWHIHGGHIYDLGSGQGAYDAAENEVKLGGYNPVLRDTTMLYKYTTGQYVSENKNYTSQGWRAWRLKVQDPGVWMLHCHILQHLIMGMQTVWVMGNASEITHGRSPDLVAGYLNYGGDAYGNRNFVENTGGVVPELSGTVKCFRRRTGYSPARLVLANGRTNDSRRLEDEEELEKWSEWE